MALFVVVVIIRVKTPPPHTHCANATHKLNSNQNHMLSLESNELLIGNSNSIKSTSAPLLIIFLSPHQCHVLFLHGGMKLGGRGAELLLNTELRVGLAVVMIKD